MGVNLKAILKILPGDPKGSSKFFPEGSTESKLFSFAFFTLILSQYMVEFSKCIIVYGDFIPLTTNGMCACILCVLKNSVLILKG